MRRSTGTANSSAQRLPVNHRRHKVAPEQRKRVATACNNCNIRRIKCSGERPCLQCRNGSRDCQYPLVVEKVSIPRSELDDLRSKVARLEQCLEQAVPDETRRRELISRMAAAGGSISSAASTTSTSNTLQSDQQSEDEPNANEGRLLHDPDGVGRYLGSTSGATFLDLVKEFMNTMFPLAWPGQQRPNAAFLGSLGRYQTFDSRPLNIHDCDPFYLPGKTEMTVMMAQLKYFIMNGSGDFASGGIYYWGDLDPSFFDGKPLEPGSLDARLYRRLGLYHAAFAMTCQLEMPSEGSNRTQRSETFFARARKVIGNPLDTNRSTVYDIPTLAMMSLYLVEMNRRDAAYMYVSLGMHIAVMHGVHRGWAHDEQEKRSFWTLYVLDRWLSVLMGRPPSIQDDAIHLPPPADIEGLPPAAGLTAHVQLSRIAGYIVCNAYRIAPWEHQMTSTAARIDNVLNWLSSWLKKLPPELQIDGDELSTDRACCELHMAYNQLLILTVRPIFFVAVKKVVAERFINHTLDLENHSQISHIRQCIDAARRNVKLGRWIRELTPSRKLLSSALHNIFNAAIILLLHQLIVDTVDQSDYMNIMFVIECYDAEARGASHYAKDCARVLRDLSSLIQQLRNRNLDVLSQVEVSPVSMVPPQPVATTAYDVGFILNPEVPVAAVSMPLLQTSSALYHELAAWMDQDDPLQLYNNYLMS